MTWLVQLEDRVTKLEKRMDDIQRLATLEAEMRTGFSKLAETQQLIMKLLTRRLGKSGDETRAGDADG